MKLIISSLGFVMLFAFAGDALADESVKLQLRVEPAANNAELDKLMRQNTVRVALQRHRLWQEAADRELDREEKQLREEKQTRAQKKAQNQHRKHTGNAVGATSTPVTTDDVAIDGEGGAEDGDGTQAREQHRYQNQKRVGAEGDKGKATGTTDRARLRDMLREERVAGGEDALEEKLQQRLREHKRQTEGAKSGTQKQHKKGGSGSGAQKRSGR